MGNSKIACEINGVFTFTHTDTVSVLLWALLYHGVSTNKNHNLNTDGRQWANPIFSA
jgi:hypothetical protein